MTLIAIVLAIVAIISIIRLENKVAQLEKELKLAQKKD